MRDFDDEEQDESDDEVKVQRKLDNDGFVNPASRIEQHLQKVWPELEHMSGIWVTGGVVWRLVYGLPVDSAKDIDLVAVGGAAMKKLEKLVKRHVVKKGDEWNNLLGPIKTSLGGETYHTDRGRVDIWETKSITQTISSYADGKENVKMAYCPAKRKLIILPTED